MVKTRQEAKKQVTAASAKTITPSKTTNRKARSIKNCVESQEVLSKTKSNQNIDETAPSKTRSCIVKLRRSCSNNKNTLQAQCKNKNGALNKKSENKARVTEKFQTNDNIVKNATTKKRKVGDLNKAELQNKNKVEILISTVKTRAKKCDNTPVIEIKNKSENRKTCDNDLKSRIKTKSKVENQSNLMLSRNLKRCTVKLQNMKILKKRDGLSPGTSKCSEKISSANNTTSIPFEVPSTPCFKRKCVVKVQKYPALSKTNGIFVKKSSTRSKKSAISNINVEENGELTDSVAIKLTSTPVIDDTKRKNFRKLSLTKCFTKLTETIQTENITKSNLKDRIEHVRMESPNHNKESQEVLKTNVESNEVKQLHSKKTKINDLKTIKHLPKLSLKKANVNTNQNVTESDITRFEPQQNSTICFDPLRNSTVLELDWNKKQHQENQNEETKKTTPSKNKSSSQNLANKSDEIENLLNSLDDDDCIIIENIQNDTKKANKFFHHKKDVMENILKEQSTISPKTQVVKKKRRLYVKRSTIAKRDNIYEFFSQSQTSDSDNAKHADPTADIIKKLIEQGRVRVATNCKGKGKPKFKRKQPTKQIKKGKQTENKNVKKLKNNAKKVTFKDKNNDDEYDEDNHFISHFENDELDSGHDFDMDIHTQDVVSNSLENHNHKNLFNDQEGTFSRLARKVLINEAGRSDQQRKNAAALLGMVKKIVSTPKNRKTALPQIALASDLSPIPMHHPRPSAMASPWRVNEDECLPKTFNFSRSSGNLPSFSSDFIPSSPRKMKAKKIPRESYQHAIMGEKSPTKSRQNLLSSIPSVQSPLRDNIQPPRTPNVSEPSVISSFSSNDSNAENMPPPVCMPENYGENDSIFDLKQIPNPRRNLNNRSPLKTINILEVVHLPPFKHPNKKTNTKEISGDQIEMFPFEKNLGDFSRRRNATVSAISAVSAAQQNDFPPKTNDLPLENLFGFEEFLPQTESLIQENIEANNNDAVTSKHNQTLNDKLQDLRNLGKVSFRGDQNGAEASAVQPNDSFETTETPVKEDLFGFEEFLPQSGFSSQESIGTNNNDTVTNNQNQTIHEKLQDLRKLKPSENELQKELLKKNSINPIKRTPLFNDDSLKEDAMRQRGIKEMLCSTMLNLQPSTSKEALRMLNNRNLKDQQQPKFGDDLDLSELFKDPDPETTFNENEAHRTYIRPYKRKRRLKENKHVFILDSDESEDEDKAHKQHSRESNSSSELAPKKKRNRKGPKERMEDLAFIEEFNEMVKEVDSYELIVEKSTSEIK